MKRTLILFVSLLISNTQIYSQQSFPTRSLDIGNVIQWTKPDRTPYEHSIFPDNPQDKQWVPSSNSPLEGWIPSKYRYPIDGQVIPSAPIAPQILPQYIPKQKIPERLLLSTAPPDKPSTNLQNAAKDPAKTSAEVWNSIPPELKKHYEQLYISNIETQVAYNQLLRTQYSQTPKVAKDTEAIRNKVFESHNVHTWVSMIAVHLLLFTGVFLAIRESLSANNIRKLASNKEQQVQVSLSGIAVKSSYVSIALLALSLAFYFLYIKYVYTLNEL